MLSFVGIETFGTFLLAQGLSEKTVRIYGKRVDAAILWFTEREADLTTARPADLVAWSQTLSPSVSSRRQARSALSYYFTWLALPDPGLKAIRVPPKPRYYCQAVDEYEAKLLHKVALEEGHPRGTAVLLGLYLALRVSEIADAKWDGFDNRLQKYTLTGKQDYTATIPVHPRLGEYLTPLPTRYRYLFPGERGRDHVTSQTVWSWIRALGQRVGIEELRSHQLRHTAIASLHDNTGDLRTAAEFARHRRIETTMIYTRTAEATLKRAVETLNY